MLIVKAFINKPFKLREQVSSLSYYFLKLRGEKFTQMICKEGRKFPFLFVYYKNIYMWDL